MSSVVISPTKHLWCRNASAALFHVFGDVAVREAQYDSDCVTVIVSQRTEGDDQAGDDGGGDQSRDE